MNSEPVLVIGGTGTVGSAVVRRLAASGIEHLVAGRSAQVRIDHDNPETYREALANVGSMISIIADRPDADAVEKRLYQAASDAGVRRIVKLSAASAGWNPPASFGVAHRAGEGYLRNLGVDWTILRPTVFQETVGMFSEDIHKGRLVTPKCRAAVAFVAIDDVAAVAVKALGDPNMVGRTLELTGPRGVTFQEIVAELGQSLGRRVKHINIPHPVARRVLPKVAGMPQWLADEIVDLFAGLQSGLQRSVAPDSSDILGKPATDISAYLDQLAGSRSPS